MIGALLLLLLFLLPGYAVWLAFAGGLRRAVTALEGTVLILLTSAIIVIWPALLLAEIGLFSLPLLLILVLGSSRILLGVTAGKARQAGERFNLHPFPGSRLPVTALLALPLFGVGLLLSPQPFEYIVGGRDHGVYVNTGLHIARTGNIFLDDVQMAALPDESRPLLTMPEVSLLPAFAPGPWSEGQRLPGLTIRDADEGVVTPHAFHLYPVWMAVFAAVGDGTDGVETPTDGLSLALATTLVFGLLGTLSFYTVAQRLFQPAAALLALLLLSLNVAQMWFNQYPSAEIVVRFYLWGGMLAFLWMLTAKSRLAAVLAGGAFGLLLLTKLDTIVLIPLPVIYLVYLWLSGRFERHYWYFIVPYALLLLHGFLHALFVATIYFLDQSTRLLLPDFLARRLVAAAAGYPDPLRILGRLVAQNAEAIGITLAGLALLLLTARRLQPAAAHLLRRGERFRRHVAAGIALILGLFATYSYFGFEIWPLPPLAPAFRTLNILGWYLTPLGLLLGFVGMTQSIGESSVGDSAGAAERRFALLIIIGGSLPLLLLGSGTVPDHFWSARRFVTLVIPGFILFAAVALWRIMPRTRAEWPRLFLPAALLLALVAGFWEDTAPIAGALDYAGIVEQIESASAEFPDDAVLLMERSDATNRVSLPLWFIFGRTVFSIAPESLDDPALTTAIRQWQASGKEVFYLAVSDAPVPEQIASYAFSLEISFPLVEITYDSIPDEVVPFVVSFDSYRIADTLVSDKK